MYRLLLFLALLPVFAGAKTEQICADSILLRAHVYKITGSKGYRNIDDTFTLNKAASYIQSELAGNCNNVHLQTYHIAGNDGGIKSYHNVIASFGPENAPRIIIGAHYDVCDQQAGADDNASGVAGLLELSRLFSKGDHQHWKYRVDLVAYTLEEPPSFKTQNMGSAIHAKYLADSNISVKGMISIEMIGYYKDAKHSQHYPLGFFKWFYGSRGNYITVVKKMHASKFCHQFTKSFKHGDNIITKVFSSPKWVTGVDWSDHLSYWAKGWAALMITDTSFFRNANYHQPTDTPDTLDYQRMSFVVTNLFLTISKMAKA